MTAPPITAFHKASAAIDNGLWGDYDRMHRTAWAMSAPLVRALLSALRMRGHRIVLRDPLGPGATVGIWCTVLKTGAGFEVDFEGIGKLDVLSPTSFLPATETVWVRADTWPWIVEHVIEQTEWARTSDPHTGDIIP